MKLNIYEKAVLVFVGYLTIRAKYDDMVDSKKREELATKIDNLSSKIDKINNEEV